MVVVSHLFFFFDKKFGESVTRYESHPPSLELSISRQPLFCCLEIYKKAEKNNEQYRKTVAGRVS